MGKSQPAAHRSRRLLPGGPVHRSLSVVERLEPRRLLTVGPAPQDALLYMGDTNSSGAIDFFDFLKLRGNYGQTTDLGAAAGDLDLNGTVDFFDFLKLRGNYGRTLDATFGAGEAARWLNEAFGKVELSMPEWAGGFDLAPAGAGGGSSDDPALPILPDDLGSRFNVAGLLDEIDLPNLAGLADFAALADTLTGFGFTIDEMPTGGSAQRLQVRWSHIFGDLAGSLDFDDSTTASLADLIPGAALNGQVEANASLKIDLVFGVDAGGAYLLGESGARLAVTGAGEIGFEVDVPLNLPGDLAIAATGTAEADVFVNVGGQGADVRYRVPQIVRRLTSEVLNVNYGGTADLGLELSVQPLELGFSGSWAFDIAPEGFDVTARMDWPNVDELVAASLPLIRGGVETILGEDAAELLDSVPIPFAAQGAGGDSWFGPMLDGYADTFADAPEGTVVATLQSRGINFESLPTIEELIALLKGGTFDGDLIRVNLGTGPTGPFEKHLDFDADDIGGLAGLGFTGSVQAGAAPAFDLTLGYDGLGVYLDPTSDARAHITATAEATGSYGGFTAAALGEIALTPILDLSDTDADGDGRLRTGEFLDNLAQMRLRVEDIDASLTTDLSIGVLDYVDVDGDPNNNSANGGDAFTFRSRISPTAGDLSGGLGALDWNVELLNPDIDQDGVSDFTNAVLLRNVAELVKDVTSGDRSLFGDETFGDALDGQEAPLTDNGLGDATGLRDSRPPVDFGNLDSIDDVASFVSDHVQILHVIDFATIRGWLESGLPATPEELIRIKVDTGEIDLLPSGALTADMDGVLPEDGGWEGSVGITDAVFSAQLVFGFDTSSSPFYLQAQGDAIAPDVTSLDAVFTARAFLANPTLLPELLSLDHAQGSITPSFHVDFSQTGDAAGKLRLDDLAGLANLGVTLGGETIDSLLIDLQATLVMPGLEDGAGDPAVWTLTGNVAGRAWTLAVESDPETPYTLDGFTVQHLAFLIAGNGTRFGATFDATMTVDPGEGSTPVEVVLAAEFDNDGLQATGSATASLIDLDGIVVIENGSVMVEVTGDWAAGTLFVEAGIGADSVTLFPGESGDDPLGVGTGIDATIDSVGNVSLEIASLTADLGGLVQISASDVSLSMGPDATGDLLHVGNVSGELTALEVDGQFPTLEVDNLRLSREGRWLFDTAEVVMPQGWTREIGIAEFLPFELERVLLDTVDGDLNDLALSVAGRFDTDAIAADWGFTPIMQVGGETGDNGLFEATLNIDDVADGKVALSDFGPVTLGFADLEIGAVTLEGQITLGGIQNGLFIPDVEGFFRIQSGLSGTGGDDGADGISIDGAVFTLAGTITPADQNSGVAELDVNVTGDVDVRFRIAEIIDFRGVSFNFDLHASNDFGDPADPFRPNVEVFLNQIGFSSAEIVFPGLLSLSAVNGQLNFNDPDELVSFDELVLVFEGLDDWGGSAQNIRVSAEGIPDLAGATISLQLPQSLQDAFPDWLPIRIDELGVKFHDTLFAAGGAGINDPFAFSVLFSGGLQAVPDGFPINASFQDLEIDLAAARSGEFPIKNIGGVNIGVEPFELIDGFTIGGGLSFGTAEIDLDGDPSTTGDIETALYGRVYGAFEFNGIGARIDLLVSEYGPVLAAVNVPLAIPLGQTSLMLSGVRGGLLFGKTFPEVDHPQDLRADDFNNPLDEINEENIQTWIGTAVRSGVSTWATPFTLVLGGSLSTVAAPGVISGDVDLLANVGIEGANGSGGGNSINFMGYGSLNLMGMGVAGVRLLAQFNDPINPKFAALFTAPQPGSPLGFLLPYEANVGVLFDSQGLAAATVLGIRTFIERTVAGGLEVGQAFFEDALDAVALSLEADHARPLSSYLLDLDGDGTVSAAEDAITITRTFLTTRLIDNLLPASINNVDAVAPFVKVVNAFQDELFRIGADLLEAGGSYDFGGWDAGYDEAVTGLFSDGQEAVFAFSRVIADAAVDAIGEALAVMDPKLILSANLQPMLAGIPLGEPDLEAQLVLSKQGLSFGAEFSVTKIMQQMALLTPASVLAMMPIPVTDRIMADIQFPFGDTDEQITQALRSIINGQLPAIDPLGENWSVILSGGYDVLGYPVGSVSGYGFPSNWSQLDQRIEKMFENPDADLDPDRVQITELGFYEAIRDFGGFLIDGGLRLPTAFQDPSDLMALLSEPPSDPLDYLGWITDLFEQIQQVSEAATATMFIPGFTDLLAFNFTNYDGDLNPRFDLAPGVTDQDLQDRINAAFFEGIFNGRILGVQLGEGRIRATAQSVTAVGTIPWLGLDASFSLASREEQIDDGAGGTRTIDFPTIGALLDFDLSEFGAAFANWGLGAVQLPINGSGTFRAFSPGFDPESDDRLQRLGGLGMLLDFSIPGLLSRGTFNLDLTPPADGSLVPDFTATATAVELDLLGGIDGLRIDNATVTIIKSGDDIRFEISGTGTLFGAAVTISGTLDQDLVGALEVTSDLSSILAPATAEGVFSLVTVRDGDNSLQARLDFVGTLILPASLGGARVNASGSFDTQSGAGSVEIDATSLDVAGFDLHDGSFSLSRLADGSVRLEISASLAIGRTLLEVGGSLLMEAAGLTGSLEAVIASGADDLQFGPLSLTSGALSLDFTPSSAQLSVAGTVDLPGHADVAFSGTVDTAGNFDANLSLDQVTIGSGFVLSGTFTATFVAATTSTSLVYAGTLRFNNADFTTSGSLAIGAGYYTGEVTFGSSGWNHLGANFYINGRLSVSVAPAYARVELDNTYVYHSTFGYTWADGWLDSNGYGDLALTFGSISLPAGFTVDGTFNFMRGASGLKLGVDGTAGFAGLTVDVDGELTLSGSSYVGSLTVSSGSPIAFAGINLLGSATLKIDTGYAMMVIDGSVSITGVGTIMAGGELDSNGYGSLGLTLTNFNFGGITLAGTWIWTRGNSGVTMELSNGSFSFLGNSLRTSGNITLNSTGSTSGTLNVAMSSGVNFSLAGYLIDVGATGALRISKTTSGSTTVLFAATLDIPGLVTDAGITGLLNNNGYGTLTIASGSGFKLGNNVGSAFTLTGTYQLRRIATGSGPVTEIRVTGAGLSWSGVTAFMVNEFTIATSGYFSASVVAKTFSLSTGLGALSVTIPSASVSSNPANSLYTFSMSGGSINLPLFEENITLPTISVGTSGTFSQNLGLRDLDIGGVVDLRGHIRFERTSGGVFRLYVYSTSTETARLQIDYWTDVELNNFYIDSNGNFDVSAKVNQFGPDFLHIDAASIKAQTYTYYDKLLNVYQGFRVYISGGVLDLPVGDSISLGNFQLDTGMTWSKTVAVSSLDIGILDIEGGNFVVSFGGGALGAYLESPSTFRVRVPGYTSTMTINEFNVAVTGNQSAMIFHGRASGNLRLYQKTLGSASYTIDLRQVGSTRYVYMDGAANLSLGWINFGVDGYLRTRDGSDGYFYFSFNGSVTADIYFLGGDKAGSGTVSASLWKSGSSLGFSGSVVGSVYIFPFWYDVNWSFGLTHSGQWYDWDRWFAI